MHDPIYKAIGALATSGMLAIVESLEVLPEVIQKLGLPIAFLVCVTYFLIVIHKKYTESVDARLVDSKDYSEHLAVHIEKGAESRAKLIELSEKSLELNVEQLKAQAKMAIALDRLSSIIQSRPCQK